jgi:hypothetical protein
MRVFISHSAGDRSFAERLGSELSKRGFSVWTDAQIRPGESWPSQIKSAIDQADAVIPILSTKSAKSQWLASELSLAVADRLSGGKKVIVPVLAEKHAEAPFFLKDIQWADLSSEERFRENIERLAQALRRGASSSAETLGDRKSVLDAEAVVLKSEIEQLAHLERTQTRFIFLTFAVVAASAAIIFSILPFTGKLRLDGPSLWRAVLAFLAGAVAGAVSSVFFWRRRKSREDHSNLTGTNE